MTDRQCRCQTPGTALSVSGLCSCPDTPAPVLTLGEELQQIMTDMDAAYAAWSAAGHPYEGEVWDAREAVYARLRDLTARAQS